MRSLHPVHFLRGRTRAVVAGATAVVLTLGLAACGAEADADTAGDGRTYESDFGPVELPEKIERIVSVDFYTPAALIDLGINPVGVVNSYFTDTEGNGIPVAYTTVVAENGATSIGEYYEMNLEAVAKADPDLIIATNDFLPMDDELRPELEKVAPILTFNARDGESWRTRAVELAKILDKSAELQPLVEKYEKRRDEIKEEYADVLESQTFTVFVPVEDEWGTYAATHFSTPILRDLGADFRAQDDDEINEFGFPNWFSYERLDRIANADVILTARGTEEARAALSDNTIWNNLPAVKNDMVFDYIPLSPTGSFGWALENLEDLVTVFEQVRAGMEDQQS